MTIAHETEFYVFRDEDEKLYIVDKSERVILADAYAYDEGISNELRDKNAMARMENIAQALNIGWSYL